MFNPVLADPKQIYLPIDQRPADSQYQEMLRFILDKGVRVPTRQGVDCLTVFGYHMHFPLAHGFPIINDRSIKGFWRTPINELGAFVNGARNFRELKAAGCHWWGDWTTPEKTKKRGLAPGDIGPGSYGAVFHDFPLPTVRYAARQQLHLKWPRLFRAPRGFDQWANVVEQIKQFPGERRHFICPWLPNYIYRNVPGGPKVTIAPCHGWVYIHIVDGRLYLEMVQRSGDTPVGVPANMVQYAAMALFLGHLTGYPAAMYVHNFINAHIYASEDPKKDQVQYVKKMLERQPKVFATVRLNEKGLAATDIHQFHGDLFELTDYEPHPGIKEIPVAT